MCYFTRRIAPKRASFLSEKTQHATLRRYKWKHVAFRG